MNELFKDADVLHHFHHTREAIHSEAKRLETLLPRKDNLACAYALFLLVAEETMQQGIVVERAPVVNLSRELAPISSALSAMPNDDKEFLYYAMLLTAANLKILNRYPVTRVEARSLAAPGFEALSTYRRSRQEARRQAAQAYSTQTPSRGSTPSDAQIQRDLNASHNMMPDHYDMLNTLQSMKKW